MKYPEVKHLYKYYAYNENSLSVLINKKIWVAKPESFNDPFDCNYNFSLKLDEEILKQGDSNIKDIQINAAATNKVLKERFSNTGIFSMSKRNNSILMWSHYANQHKGFCIEFERKPESILGNDDVTKRVDYEDDYSDIEMFDQSGKVNLHFFKKMFFVKAKDWKYEDEWRFVRENGDKESDIPSAISSIIFGLKMPQEHRDTIKNILSGQGIRYKEAVKTKKLFQINIIDLPE